MDQDIIKKTHTCKNKKNKEHTSAKVRNVFIIYIIDNYLLIESI